MQAVPMKGHEKLNLSGIYSSKKNNNFSERNNLTTRIDQFSVAGRYDSINFLPPDFPVNNQNYKEEIDKRTITSRTFKDEHGGIIIQYSSKKLNYLDKENKFHPINTKLFTVPISSTNRPKEFSAIQKGEQGFCWAALQQQYPTYLYKDGSTALTSGEKNKIIFNRDCRINEMENNLSDYSVGAEGMFINNVIPGIDKKIIFYENMIETDYIIREPINTGDQDLIISEEIELPEGYYITPLSSLLQRRGELNPSLSVTSTFPMERGGQTASGCLSQPVLRGEIFVVYSPDGKEQARFGTPFFYDSNKTALLGKYNLVQEQNKYILEIIIPTQWLNDPGRSYPVTIDPVVTGPVSNYPSVYMSSCEYPVFQKDSMLITIPADITITKFIVEDSYFADLLATPTPTLLDGHMLLSTSCGSLELSCSDTAFSSLPGTCYILPNTDFKLWLACCYTPSCSIQTFYLTHGFSRSNLGPFCNQDYIYYSPVSNWPFSAYIVGKTVETTQAEWSVFPVTVCSDSCIIYLKATTKYGVPPYTITHPWATGSSQYGVANGSCNSIGTDTITLIIPGCPSTCNTNTTLDIPPPVIVDVCGDTVAGLSSKTITINPVPVATLDSVNVCSGIPFTIPVSSCVAGTSFQWTGSNGSSGTGNIDDFMINPGTTPVSVNYTVIPETNGCTGDPTSVSIDINPLPVITGSANDTIDPGDQTQLSAIGGVAYSWSPSAGLSCTGCSTPIATPVITTYYYVTGTNEYGCSGTDTIDVYVNQGTEVLYIPNSFSPNNNEINDFFCVYGTSIKNIDIQIYNRWGELLFHTTDLNQGWDGKYKGKNVAGGVYVYSVACEWESGERRQRSGTITVLR